MSALTRQRKRSRTTRGALVVAAVLLAVLVGGLVILTRSGAHSNAPITQRVVGAPAPGPLANAPHVPDPAAASAARTFLSGYLAYVYGQAGVGQIRDASRQLIAELARTRPESPPPGARPARLSVRALGAQEASGRILHLTALVSDGISRYPVGLVMVHDQRGWEATRLASAE